mgnify:CR=1 FL=1
MNTLLFPRDRVTTESWEVAIFQDMGSSPATMEAGKSADAYGCFPGNDTEQADAEQAYVQAELRGTETWIWLPPEAWEAAPKDVKELYDTTISKMQRPVVRLRKA